MRLVFIYGPPAVGKLTVAKELAALTGFKVFHNHLTFDLAEAIFPFMSRPFGKLIDGTRMIAFELAAEEGVDLIFTGCYAYLHDDLWVRGVMDLIESKGGKVHFVQLTCPCEILEERVVLPDRGRFGKLASVEKLRETMGKWDLFTPVPFCEHICIDTSAVEPAEAANMIVKEYDLQCKAS